MNTRRGGWIQGILLLLLPMLLPLAGAQDPSPPADAAAQLAALEAERDASELAYGDLYEAFKPRFEAFAAEHTGTEQALTAELWLLRQTWWLRKAEGAPKMYEAAEALVTPMLEQHIDSPQLEGIGAFEYVFSKDTREVVFSRLLEGSPHARVQAAALFSLAKKDMRSKDFEGKARGLERMARLAKEHGDRAYRHTTYGEIADAHLHPIDAADLAIGKAAPEIVGADHEGNEMKLSDYRGKVVVLDFWGDW